jgi:hypothetical protein
VIENIEMLHDFGYRSFGKGPYTVSAGDSSNARKSVDERFDTLMNRKSNHNRPSVVILHDTAETTADQRNQREDQFSSSARVSNPQSS